MESRNLQQPSTSLSQKYDAQYYSKEYVEDIEHFYKREREEYRLKILTLERLLD